MIDRKLAIIVLFCAGLLFFTASFSSDRYFLCGPDEDGCYAGIYQYCSCIPYNDLEANNRYCLDVYVLKCTPLSETPTCNPAFIYKNQGECLATIFQSEPTPPCTVTTHFFCLKEHVSICAPDGQVHSCHPDIRKALIHKPAPE